MPSRSTLTTTGALVEMAEMEELEAEIGVELALEQGLVRLEADVAPGVEIEVGEAVRQRRDRRVIGGGREFARALDDVLIAERRLGGSALRRFGLGGGGRKDARPRGGGGAEKQRAAGEVGHGVFQSERRAAPGLTRRSSERNSCV